MHAHEGLSRSDFSVVWVFINAETTLYILEALRSLLGAAFLYFRAHFAVQCWRGSELVSCVLALRAHTRVHVMYQTVQKVILYVLKVSGCYAVEYPSVGALTSCGTQQCTERDEQGLHRPHACFSMPNDGLYDATECSEPRGDAIRREL